MREDLNLSSTKHSSSAPTKKNKFYLDINLECNLSEKLNNLKGNSDTFEESTEPSKMDSGSSIELLKPDSD